MMSDSDLDPVALESMRRSNFDRSKWLQTATAEIAKYQYNREELNQFYNELQDVVGRVKAKFTCQLCNQFPKKSLILACGCILCAKCASRFKKQSICPKCKISHFDFDEPKPFYAIDTMAGEMASFSKEAKFFLNQKEDNSKLPDNPKEAAKRLKSMNFVLLQRLKNMEAQLMCDFCFNRINKTHLVNCSSSVFTFRPFCQGCDARYIKFYETEQGKKLRDPFAFEPFDFVVDDFYEFMEKTVEYSKSSKIPIRFMSSGSSAIDFTPIYKMIAGFAIIGLVMLYYSS